MSRGVKEERSRLEKAVDAVKGFLHLDAPPRKSGSPPLGTGAAEGARSAIRDRGSRIDRELEKSGG